MSQSKLPTEIYKASAGNSKMYHKKICLICCLGSGMASPVRMIKNKHCEKLYCINGINAIIVKINVASELD